MELFQWRESKRNEGIKKSRFKKKDKKKEKMICFKEEGNMEGNKWSQNKYNSEMKVEVWMKKSE